VTLPREDCCALVEADCATRPPCIAFAQHEHDINLKLERSCTTCVCSSLASVCDTNLGRITWMLSLTGHINRVHSSLTNSQSRSGTEAGQHGLIGVPPSKARNIVSTSCLRPPVTCIVACKYGDPEKILRSCLAALLHIIQLPATNALRVRLSGQVGVAVSACMLSCFLRRKLRLLLGDHD
jgi:hypothetical protein